MRGLQKAQIRGLLRVERASASGQSWIVMIDCLLVRQPGRLDLTLVMNRCIVDEDLVIRVGNGPRVFER